MASKETIASSLLGAGLLLSGCPDMALNNDGVPTDDDDSSAEVTGENQDVTRQGLLDTLYDGMDYDQTALAPECVDVPVGDQAVWAAALNDGVIGPYTDAEGNPTFCGPENLVTRAEGAKVVVTFENEVNGITAPPECEFTFPDVDYAAWYGSFVDSLCSLAGDQPVGYPNGTFGPADVLQQPDLDSWLTAIED